MRMLQQLSLSRSYRYVLNQPSNRQPHVQRLVFLLSALLLMTQLALPTITYADTTLCTGYSGCNSAGYTDHGYGANSGTSYWGAFTGHNCTNYVAYVESQINHVTKPSGLTLGNAGDWYSEAAGYFPESATIPVVGAVAWWSSTQIPSVGHVAYVESVTGTSITVSEDAYGGNFDWKTIPNNSSNWPGGFIYFANLSDGTGHVVGKADFNHDGIPDFVTYNGGTWNVYNGAAGNAPIELGVTLGGPSDIPLIGDVNGDGTPDFIVYSGGYWSVKSGASGNAPIELGFQFGASTDKPLVTDFNRDGHADFVIDSGGQWAIRSGVNGNPYLAQGVLLGDNTSTPLMGDFNNDGIPDFAVDTGGTWAVKSGVWPNNYIEQGVHFGNSTSIPLTADFNHDGISDFVTYDGGTWNVLSGVSGNNVPVESGVTWGNSASIPLLGDFNSDGTPDFVYFSNCYWYVESGATGNAPIEEGVYTGSSTSTPLTN